MKSPRGDENNKNIFNIFYFIVNIMKSPRGDENDVIKNEYLMPFS